MGSEGGQDLELERSNGILVAQGKRCRGEQEDERNLIE